MGASLAPRGSVSLGRRQERFLVEAIEQHRRIELYGLTPPATVWAHERQLGAMIKLGYFVRAHELHPAHVRKACSWEITELGLKVAAVVKLKWHLAGYGKSGSGVSFKGLVVDDPIKAEV